MLLYIVIHKMGGRITKEEDRSSVNVDKCMVA